MSGERPLVVVADDDPDILELIRIRLERLGCDVGTAADGDAALALIRARRPALVVLDVSMPGLTGYAVTEVLRAQPETSTIPVLLLTARVQEADVERGFIAGATEYMTKPFSPQALGERVLALLSPPA